MKQIRRLINAAGFLLALLFVLVIIKGCTEEILPTESTRDQSQSPFSLSLDVNSNFFNLDNPNYILQTSFKNENGINQFSGTYLEAGCSDICGPSLKVTFYDIEERSLEETKIEEVLREGTYEYATTLTLPLVSPIKFQALPNTDVASADVTYCWSDGTGNVICGEECLLDTTFYPISLTAQYTDGTSIEYTRAISIAATDLPSASVLSPPQICVSSTDDNSLFTLGVDNLNPGDTVIWHTGQVLRDVSGNEIVLSQIEMEDPVLVQIFNPLELISNTNEIAISVEADRFRGKKCFSGFQILATDVAGINLNLGRVSLEYTDSEGEKFITDNPLGSGSSRFEVFNIREFDKDPQGNPSKIFDIEFSADLFNPDSGEIILLDRATATFAISYPGN